MAPSVATSEGGGLAVFDAFEEIWLVDFEFGAPAGERPAPVCMVAREFRTGRIVRIWQDELARIEGPPFRMDPDVLYVAYYASAELGFHLALGWTMPARILDLYIEFQNQTNGLEVEAGRSLLGTLVHYGLPCVEVEDKESMRTLALRGGRTRTESSLICWTTAKAMSTPLRGC